MMNDEQKIMDYMAGYVAGSAEDERGISWPLLMLFLMIGGNSPKIESICDLKNVVSDFNDKIQNLEIPDLEVTANED